LSETKGNRCTEARLESCTEQEGEKIMRMVTKETGEVDYGYM
jgi:hypothetical protein